MLSITSPTSRPCASARLFFTTVTMTMPCSEEGMLNCSLKSCVNGDTDIPQGVGSLGAMVASVASFAIFMILPFWDAATLDGLLPSLT